MLLKMCVWGGDRSKKKEKSVISIPWDKCSGCGYCQQICPVNAIEMKSDSHGFMHPNVELNKCIQCGKCLNECPYQDKGKRELEDYPQSIFAAWSIDDEVIANSSSGGMFYELAKKMIQKGGIVYGAAFDENFSLVHRRINRIEDIKPLMGSKYVQSNAFISFDSVIKDIESGEKVLFVGTPCQISALKKLLDKNKHKNNLLLVDFVCHGVPSQMLIRDYIQYTENYFNSKIKEYVPRSKIKGWGHNELLIFNNDKKEYRHPISQSYRNIFYSNCALRASCYNCPYTDFHRPGDLTIADYWGIEQKRPDLYRKEGVSLFIVNSENGKRFVDSIDTLVLSETDRDTIIKEKQPHLYYPIKKPDIYRKFWEEYERKGWQYIIEKYAECKRKNLLKWKIKRILGKVK